MPAAEVDVTVDLVRALLREQHPDLADLRLHLVANGWDNVVFRLGEHLAVRVPRRRAAAVLLEHEQRWLPRLAPALPLPVPDPVRVGRPSADYPWRWSVVPWFAGDVAADVGLGDPEREAERLGAFVAALHADAPAAAPRNPVRGHPVAALDERIEVNVDALGERVDAAACRRRWRELRRAAEWPHGPVWLHGDLHAANVVVRGGEIVAVVDFGDIAGGDPAVDLAIAWMLFEPPARAVFRDRANAADPATWARAQAWALHFALLYLLNSADAPQIAGMGRRLLAAVLADEAPWVRAPDQSSPSKAGG